jgi:DUF917 family protein
VKLPISSQGERVETLGWRKGCGGGGSSKIKKDEMKKEIRKKMKMRIIKK